MRYLRSIEERDCHQYKTKELAVSPAAKRATNSASLSCQSSAFASQIAEAQYGIELLLSGDDKQASSVFEDVVQQLRNW